MHLVDTTMFWSPTGGGVRRYLLAKQAWLGGQAGWRHTLAVPSNGWEPVGPTTANQATVGLPSLQLPGRGGYRLPLRRGAISERLDQLCPDLIEAGDPYVLAWASLDVATARGIPAVAFCHSNLEAMARLLATRRLAGVAARIARRYALNIYRHFDLVMAPSRSMCDHLKDWGLTRVAHQPLGVDTALFHPGRGSARWRQAHGIAPHERLLVYAGRFGPEKHLAVLADAVERLGEPYRLLFIGAGRAPWRSPRVQVLPFVADRESLAEALASADAFVHAGDQETFGLAALEALACGTPVVAQAREGLAELVDDTVGVAVPDGRAASFAEAIASLFSTGLSLDTRRSAARARAESFSWDRVFTSLTGHYGSLVRGTRQPIAGLADSLSRSVL